MTEATPTDNTETGATEGAATDTSANPAFAACTFDSVAATAMHGSSVIAMVLDQTGTNLLAISGQQGLSVDLEAETSEAKTKDGNGTWAIKTAGAKSWTMSIDGLYDSGDEARGMIIRAIKNGTKLCVGAFKREELSDGSGVRYTPIRKGLAIPTSDSIDAPNDDNVTYSLEFEGTGELWMIETATAAEVTAMTFTINTDGTYTYPVG